MRTGGFWVAREGGSEGLFILFHLHLSVAPSSFHSVLSGALSPLVARIAYRDA